MLEWGYGYGGLYGWYGGLYGDDVYDYFEYYYGYFGMLLWMVDFLGWFGGLVCMWMLEVFVVVFVFLSVSDFGVVIGVD